MKKWLNSSSITSRLVVMIVLGFVGFLAILFGNYSFYEQLNRELASLQSVDLRVVQATNALQVGLSDLNRLYEAAVVERDMDTLEEANDMASQQRMQIESLVSLSPVLTQRVTSLLDTYTQYVTETSTYTADVVTGKLDGDRMYGAFSAALEKREAYDKALRALSAEVNANFFSTMSSLQVRSDRAISEQITFGLILMLLLIFVFYWMTRKVASSIETAVKVAGEIAEGNLDVVVESADSEEFQRLSSALDSMRNKLKAQSIATVAQQKRQHRIAILNETLRGELTLTMLGDHILRTMNVLLGSLAGAFYVRQEDVMMRVAAHAVGPGLIPDFRLGEGLVGQAATREDLTLVRDLPGDYARIGSGLGQAAPRELMLVPLYHNGQVLGLIELMSFRGFSEEDTDFITQSAEGMAIALNSALSRVQLAGALERMRQQANALEQQQEELRATNDELEEQASALKLSQESLQTQQEELRVMNEELEERNRLLDRQKEEIARKNDALEVSRSELQGKAVQLEQNSRYKSEFLSTMSHELRTPLNSILILSQGLMDNKNGNLMDRQIEHARVINSSGRDLLMLINDILDLSKVEEGKIELVKDTVPLEDFALRLREQFSAQAESKGLAFDVGIDKRLPAVVRLDEHRLMQILRNFISNALKFTHNGSIKVLISEPSTVYGTLVREEAVQFSVKDTGIGIPREKQDVIFEAFRQVDSTISRKYGGTGLGLTISRKLAHLMGGNIDVRSDGENQGSTFSLILPRDMPVEGQVDVPGHVPGPVTVADEPASLRMMMGASEVTTTGDALLSPVTDATSASPPPEPGRLLIIEDNPSFSSVLQSLAEEFGFESVCAHNAADAYRYLEMHVPGSIILDLGLPDAPGEQLLKHIKSHPRTARVPVHVISGIPNVQRSKLDGARDFIAKPFGRERLDQLFRDIESEMGKNGYRRVLVIEDDDVQLEAIRENFARQNIPCDFAKTGEEAISQLQREHYGAIVLDLDLPDCDGSRLAERIRQQPEAVNAPIIVHTARELSKKEDAELRRYASRIVLKTDRSIARLLNETTLFLHWLKGPETTDSKPALPPLPSAEAGMKRLLLVDDDIRNLYSLSAVLEDSGLEVTTAGTGIEALKALDESGPFDIVLMDIMMPEMDGMEAMRRIRADARFQKIPIIALTAKAMRDDRAKCIEAGANDYMAKPVDNAKLQSMVKLWLGQG